MVRYIISFLFILFHISSLAQREGNIWYFGDKAGVDFNAGAPVNIQNSAMNTGHGCACISGRCTGDILFYTNGQTVWDRTHNVMPGGTGLLGDKLSTQSAIIVPHPDTTKDVYYIFTVQQSGSGGIHYSVVNMNSNGGLGDIVTTSKNTPLVTPTVEKLTAVKHKNNEDVWVITHKLNTNEFFVYLVTKNGLNPSPIISSVGTIYDQDAIEGYLKASPDGKFLATAMRNLNTYDIFDFDFETGVVSNQRRLNANYPGAYGVEFSPDGTKLYATMNSNGLYQFDLTGGTVTSIQSSEVLLSNVPNVAIQLGPDRKIYTNEGRYLGVINNPNVQGTGCNYVDKAVYLGATVFGNSGLPTFLQSYFSPISIIEKNLCFGQQTNFSLSNLQEIDSINWDFGDPASGVLNSSKSKNPLHQYDNPGKYTVEVIYHGSQCNSVISDTISKVIEILNIPAPNVNLGLDTVICEGIELTLVAQGTSASFIWSDNSSGSEIKVKDEGLYWAEVSNSCGTDRDSIQIDFFNTSISLDLGGDTAFCKGNSVTLDVSQPDVSIAWNDGNDQGYNTISKEGKYWVDIKDRCYTFSDTILVDVLEPPVISLPADTVICPGEFLMLDVTAPETTYEWQDGSTNGFYRVREEGSYFVNMRNRCGKNRSQMTVYYKDCSCSIFLPNAFSPNGDGMNDTYNVFYSCDFDSFELSIYNRWGELVYQTKNPDAFWDGSFDGSPLPGGVYVYEVKYKGINNLEIRDEERRGKISLLK